jgi:hypothetical protein
MKKQDVLGLLGWELIGSELAAKEGVKSFV